MADIVPFPNRKADIAGEAREFAEKIEADEYGRIDAALVITSGGSLQCHYWGDNLDLVQAIGILETAKMNLVRKLLEI